MQFLKAKEAIFFTLLGIVIDASDVHSENAYLPRLVTLLGIVIDESNLQL